MAYALFLLSFGFLLRIQYGVLAPYRDSGDLVAAAATLGIAHPPGYPLYVLCAKAWTLLFPFANLAYRVNLFSAVSSALAAVFLYIALTKWVSRSAACAAAAAWILAPSVVQLSIVSEMYALNALWCAFVLWSVSKHVETSRSSWISLAFFSAGLGLNNHPTLIFFIPGLLGYVWFHAPENSIQSKLLRLGELGLWGILGFSLVIYDPIRSFRNPLLDWGDPENLRNLWRLITRSDYGGLKLHPEQSHFSWTGGLLMDQLKLFAGSLLSELRWPGVALLAAGIGFYFYRKMKLPKPETWVFGIPFLIGGPLFFILSNLPISEETTLPILEPYLMMVILAGTFWIAFAWDSIVKIWKPAITLLLVLIFAGFYRPESRRGEFDAYDYGKNLAKTLPLNSSLYEPDDVTAFTFSYLQAGESYRTDVALLMTLKTFWGYRQIRSRYPEIAPQEEFPNAQGFIAALLRRHLESGRPLLADHPSKFPSEMAQRPAGLLARAGAGEEKDWEKAGQIFDFYVERSAGELRESERDFFTRHLRSKMSSAYNNTGVWLQNRRKFDAARGYFEEALGRSPNLSPAWNNFGLNYYLQADYAGAEAVFQKGILRAEDPRTLYIPLGLSQRRLGKRAESKASLIEGVKRNPANPTAQNELGLIEMEERNWEAAKGWFNQALEAQPGYSTAYYNLGLVNRNAGLNEEAARSFENYLRAEPGATDAPEVRKWISALRRR